MTAVEVVLILIGVVFLLGSFFVTERLTPTEISRVAELSEDELRIVMEREMGVASAKISDIVDNTVDLSVDKVQRSMEKVSNEKIMAISEYSDSVMEKLKKSFQGCPSVYAGISCMPVKGFFERCKKLKRMENKYREHALETGRE